MKKSITPFFVLLLSSLLFILSVVKKHENQSENQNILSNSEAIVRAEDSRSSDQNEIESEESTITYTSILKKNVIPLRIFDFFNIL